MSEWPFVSVIVPAFNAADTIEDLLSSLLALDYPVERYEVIVVDNGSTDNTRQIVEQYPVRLLEERETRGPAAARNKGIRHARGGIIAFTDADCIADRYWLKMLLADHADPTIGGFAGDLKGREPPQTKIEKIFNRHRSNTPIRVDLYPDGTKKFSLSRRAPIQVGQRERMWLRWGLVHYYKRRSPIPWLPWAPTPNVAYRRVVFEKIGLFDVGLPRAEDVDLAWRMQLYTDYELHPAPESIIYYRYPTTLAEMLKYRHRGGLGKLFILDKYLGMDRSIRRQIILESSLNLVLDALLSLGVLTYRCLKVLLRGGQPYPLYLDETLLELLGGLSYNGGRIHACLRWGQIKRYTYLPVARVG